MFFIFFPFLFLPGFLIYSLSFYFFIWSDVVDFMEKITDDDDGFVETFFSWQLFRIFLKVVFFAVIAAVINLGLIYLLFRSVFDYLCGAQWVQLILAVGPLIIEIVGYVLSVIGIGVPIVGIGVFFEVFSMLCDLLNGDWVSLILGLIGLIPVAGLPFGGGKTVKKIADIVSDLS